MKKRTIRGMGARFAAVAVLSSVLLSLGSCGSGYAMLSRSRSAEAAELKEYCKEREIGGDDVTAADSLFAMASRGGGAKKRFEMMDKAVLHYRIAIASDRLARTEEQLGRKKESLAKVKEELDTYRQVLEELNR